MKYILYRAATAAAITTAICGVLLVFVLWTEHAYDRGIDIATYECNAE